MKDNKKISTLLREIGELLEIYGKSAGSKAFKSRAYFNASEVIDSLDFSLKERYEKDGTKGILAIKGIGKSISSKIEEFLKTNKILYLEKLREDTAIRQVVSFYFKTKGVSLDELKKSAKKKEIIYSRYTKPAKQLIELSGSVANAKKSIEKVSTWAISRNLDYSIETVFKKWLELDQLKPKKIIKKPYYMGNPLIWSESKRKWFVVDQSNNWLEFADTEDKIDWKIVK